MSCVLKPIFSTSSIVPTMSTAFQIAFLLFRTSFLFLLFTVEASAIMDSYKTGASSCVHDNRESFCHLNIIQNVSVYFIIALLQAKNGFRFGFTFDTLPSSLVKSNYIGVVRRENSGKGVRWRQRHWSTLYFY